MSRERPPPAAASAGGRWSRTELLWLGAVTFVAGLLRLWHLETWSLAAAEAATWRAATLAEPAGFGAGRLLHALFEAGILPRHGEGWLRLPYAFAGLCAVPVLALAGAPFVGRGAALLAAALLAVHPWHVELSQRAAGPAPALTLAVLALGCAALARRMALLWSGAALALLLAGLCHPAAWVYGHAAGAVLLLARWRAGRRPAAVALPALLGLGGTLAVVFAARPAGSSGSVTAAVLLAGEFFVAAAPLVVLALAVPLLHWPHERQARTVLLAVFGVPLALALLLAALVMPLRGDDLVFALPPLLLLVAAGAAASCAHLRSVLDGPPPLLRWIPAPLLALALLGGLGVDSFLYAVARAGERPDWRRASELVMANTGRGRLRVLAAAGEPPLLYYLRPEHHHAIGFDPHPGRVVARLDLAAPDLDAQIAMAAERGEDLFLVVVSAERQQLAADPVARPSLAAGFRLVAVLPGGSTSGAQAIYLYERILAG